jgi:hypothetical protein
MKSIWIKRKRGMSKRLKGWRKIRKRENLRPGRWVTNSSGVMMAHFLRWHPDNRMVAIIEIWGCTTREGRDYSSISIDPRPRRPTPGISTRVVTLPFDIRFLRVVA